MRGNKSKTISNLKHGLKTYVKCLGRLVEVKRIDIDLR